MSWRSNPSSKLGIRIAFIYVCWIGMMAVHELGHVVHAWLSGGRIERVVLPWLGFSRTDLSHNPHPFFVACGGVLWGCLMPVGLLLLTAALRFRWVSWIQFFAGFCLVANGAYLAAGPFVAAGDAVDLMRLGAPRWILIAGGIFCAAAGLFLWHRLGLRDAGGRTLRGPGARASGSLCRLPAGTNHPE